MLKLRKLGKRRTPPPVPPYPVAVIGLPVERCGVRGSDAPTWADMGGKQALFEAKGRTLLSQSLKVLADQKNGPCAEGEGSEEGEKEPPIPSQL